MSSPKTCTECGNFKTVYDLKNSSALDQRT